MKTSTRVTVILATIAAVGSLLAAPVFAAESQWDKNHPRQAQVNNRLKNQNKRITNELKRGETSKEQARQLRANVRAIRKEEKLMASQNGGHLTKADQRALNQRLNQNSKEIGR